MAVSKTRQTVKDLTALCEEVNGIFTGTHYERLGIQLKEYAMKLKGAFATPRKAQFEIFVEDQKALMAAVVEVQALIQVSMDQQRPMTREEVMEYMQITPTKMKNLINKWNFPRGYALGSTSPSNAPVRWRKHEVDCWLYDHPRGTRVGKVPPSDIGSAVAREDRIKQSLNVIKFNRR